MADTFEFKPQTQQQGESVSIEPELGYPIQKHQPSENAEQGVRIVNQQIQMNPEVREYFDDLVERIMTVVNAGHGEGLLAWIERGSDKDEPVHQWMENKIKTLQA